MPSGRERLARVLIDRTTPTDRSLPQAVVTVVSADTPPKVTVTWKGGTYVFPHHASYSPTVGDVVTVAPHAGSYLILGRPVGHP